jgi:hypothetical protein
VPEVAWLFASFVMSVVGMGWLALTLDVHWWQVRNSPLRVGTRKMLRVCGYGMVGLSLLVSFIGNHPSMAPLVWFMEIALSALLVAVLLSWWPRLLGALAPRRFVG